MSEELKIYTEEEIEQSYKGRCICDKKELGMGYCGSCSIRIHKNQLADKNSWVHVCVDRWIREVTKETRQPYKELVEENNKLVTQNAHVMGLNKVFAKENKELVEALEEAMILFRSLNETLNWSEYSISGGTLDGEITKDSFEHDEIKEYIAKHKKGK